MIIKFLDVVIGGMLMGGIYALIAVGFGLQYGVARVLNIAHGEFIMLGAFCAWTLFTAAGISPLASIFICAPFFFAIGFVIYRILYTPLRVSSGSPAVFEGNSMLASFGFLFVIQNLALIIWGAPVKGYSYMAFPIHVLGTVFSANRIVTLLASVILGGAFYVFVTKTRTGKAIRASAQDPHAAELMGVRINTVLALCFGLGAMMASLGGLLLSMTSVMVSPVMGMEYTLIAIIVVVLGGLGNLKGSFLGGFILGLVGYIVTSMQPGLSMVAFYLIFLFLLLVRPTGLFSK
ncbi:MAG: branched-chain amino acid ABC transporter permease [Deltaproteobacteria bacterium HGW-Deltaproteobacteria-15]|jgi:branched-chain amino acid transport system permease protein|nr:branched-chain amino acid ABC transporter permease [Desulfobacterales bacterium]PKN62256.1 MAG: branched-chain amino acid ABC transporter permease [Deltaproteobacteria bacterium HGW-Deltaproteobacteria-15]